MPSMRAAGLGHAPAVGSERGVGSAGTKRQISERARDSQYRPCVRNSHGEVGSKVAASLGTPHGASLAPGWEAGDALVARARPPTVRELAYLSSTANLTASLAPISPLSDGVVWAPVEIM